MQPRAKKRFGQNFLHDRGAVERILDAVAARPGEAVLEIGPGRGILTTGLIAAAGKITAVELDRDLADRLVERFDHGVLQLVQGDILELDLASVAASSSGEPQSRWVVVGNLPYNISKPVAMKLVREAKPIELKESGRSKRKESS